VGLFVTYGKQATEGMRKPSAITRNSFLFFCEEVTLVWE
jgi:hypothetical protein